MHEAAKRGNYEFLKECIGNKISVNSLDQAGNTPLHWASYGGHVDCVELLFQSDNLIVNLQVYLYSFFIYCKLKTLNLL